MAKAPERTRGMTDAEQREWDLLGASISGLLVGSVILGLLMTVCWLVLQ